MSSIVDVVAREILDSRGNPTVEADVLLESGVMGRAAVPSGASTGAKEAIELRDGDPQRYLGKGVLRAVEHVNTEICEAIIGLDAVEQSLIDQTLIELDGTENKARLGANAMLAVSLAVAKAAAEESGLPLYRYLGGAGRMQLPVPMMNVINGGAHANNSLDLQEFMIIPVGVPSFREALRCGAEIFHTLKKLIDAKRHAHHGGRRGRFRAQPAQQRGGAAADHGGDRQGGLHAWHAGRDRPRLRQLGVLQGRQVRHRVRGAASSARSEFTDYLAAWVDKYPIISIEDGMAEDDWDGWKILTDRLGDNVQLVGDDLFVTNTTILRRRHQRGVANSILIKINQIGTVTETFAAIEMAKRAGYTAVVSHRSGETEDTIIADIAVATNALQIKTGSLSRSDRMAKYNQLLRIEEDLGDSASYAGRDAFYQLY